MTTVSTKFAVQTNINNVVQYGHFNSTNELKIYDRKKIHANMIEYLQTNNELEMSYTYRWFC